MLWFYWVGEGRYWERFLRFLVNLFFYLVSHVVLWGVGCYLTFMPQDQWSYSLMPKALEDIFWAQMVEIF